MIRVRDLRFFNPLIQNKSEQIMNVPNSVFQAVIAIWAGLIIETIEIIFEQKSGNIPKDLFIFLFIAFSFFSIFPYKIFNQSNIARYIYSTLILLSILWSLGSEEPTTKSKEITSIILPIINSLINLFIFNKLFSRESNIWFSTRN